MTEDLKRYLIDHCRKWMLPEEIKAIRRIALTDEGEEMMMKFKGEKFKTEYIYGFNDEKTNELLRFGEENLEEYIAKRILDRENTLILNKCPKCNNLARTPFAKQCRHCSFDWH